MTNETCPHCGAEISYHSVSNYRRYKCGALVWGDGSTSYAECECLKRQIKQRDVEIERLRQAVLDEREACAKICDDLHWSWHMGDTSGPMECAVAIRARGCAAYDY